ncbi:hypothetical protein VNO78_23640 [Psophocarpus tetragonolobus]|uniref:Uncharacterized protein n=1 Tax=Psophocarpus tetragonolobus TaxID=3891 RepID=A0AAN9XDS4_PSOTE
MEWGELRVDIHMEMGLGTDEDSEMFLQLWSSPEPSKKASRNNFNDMYRFKRNVGELLCNVPPVEVASMILGTCYANTNNISEGVTTEEMCCADKCL